MRAIIKCITTVDPQKLDGLLIEKDWWPGLDQNHTEVLKHKEDILSHVADEDRAIAENTFLYTIYDEATKSWGIINNPTKHGVTFRVKNPDSDRLKRACERLARNLQELSSEKKRGEIGTGFDFISKIEVLEPNSTDHAYSGEVLPADRKALAIQQKRNEFWVGVLALGSALLLLVITLPPIETLFLGSLTVDWHDYWKGFLDRLGTSAFVTATISGLNVLLHYFEISRKSIIRWTFD